MAEQLASEKTMFLEALEIESEADRNRFLDEACQGDAALRAKVQALLDAHARPQPLLDVTSASGMDKVGTLIGPYKLLEQIGEGGFGVVFMAEQTEPVRRRVALKVLKPGMDTRQVVARFEAERQALAIMDHPNIAKIFDAGTIGGSSQLPVAGDQSADRNDSLATGHRPLATPAGRPFFVMELVRGIPITEYCDQNHLTPRERLELFVTVCHAVQHAHQKGLIHRDLKPSNVLVSRHDTTPIVKIIDFGVAKALGQSLTDKTLFTGIAQMIGTPLYMSPEQAGMSDLDVDTRSDIYSLGVLLYELLTGTTPFDKERLKSVGFDEMRRIIREEEPETVSARIARTRSQLQIADCGLRIKARNGDFRRSFNLQSAIRNPKLNELDWIVMKSLEKDRSRRYESASALAADIQRYLSDEPVLACPPTAMYRFQKFARKHKAALTTAAAIAACLILGTTVSAWQAVRATTAEARATANEQKASTERDEARKQRDEVEALNEKLRASNAQLQATQAELRRTLYASNVNLARHAWDANDAGQPQKLLAQHFPKPGEPDLRGFEWYYLYRVIHPILDLETGDGSVAYSPDGKRLVCVRNDQIKIFDAHTGRLVLTFNGGGTGGNWNNGLAFSPDGKRLFGSAGRGTQEAKLWEAETGQELLVFKGSTGNVEAVAFSPDGKRVASAGWTRDSEGKRGGEAKVWDAETGKELLSLRTPNYRGMVGSLAFSPDGKQTACGSVVFDAHTGKELFNLNQPMDTFVAYSPDGKCLATATKLGLKVWDAQTGQELLNIQGIPDGATNVAYSPDGNFLAGTCNDRTVKLWDARTGREASTIKGIGWWADSLAFSPDGKRLATNGGYTIRVWDVSRDQRYQTLPVTDNGYVASAAFSPDGKRLATSVRGSASKPGEVKVWDAHAGNELLSLSVGTKGQIGSVAFSPDGKRLATTDGESLKIWDALTGQELRSLDHQNQDLRRSLSFSPDGKRLAACSIPFNPGRQGLRGPSIVKVWDAETFEELLSFQDTNHVESVRFSPDGKHVVASIRLFGTQPQNTGDIKFWDAKTGREMLTIKSRVGYGTVGQIALSPNGKLLAGANGCIWDTETGKELFLLPGYFDYCTGIVFSPDSKRVVASSADKTVKVFDAETGRELLVLEGHSGNSNAIAFSADGNRLACGGANGTVKIYDATPLPEKP